MELPQAPPFGTQGRRKPTHNFLSLYSHSSGQQDPRPSSQGSYLETHDFLQPLEREEGKVSAKDEAADEKQPPPSAEHLLPGGFGTYSISHISYNFNNQRVPKPEASLLTVAQASSTDRNDESSNCSSYTTGSGFTLWEESAVNKGKTGKENNVADKPISEDSAAAKLGQWALTDRTSHWFSNTRQNSFNPLPSSQTTRQKNRSFLEMIKSAKDLAQYEELDNEEAFVLKKECSNTQTGELRVKVDDTSTDQKPNTPRSKHSATEQRRRCKINDRFQMLRELIPHSDQKRDKASFLSEVIEYIHFLQEKVHKYEGSYQMWNDEPEKLMPWKNDHRPAESYVDQSRTINGASGPSPTSIFASKFDEKNITISPAFPGCTQNIESNISPETTFKAIDQHPGITNKVMPIPVSSESNFNALAQGGSPDGVVSQLTHRLASDAENNIYQPHSCTTKVTAANDKLKEKELTIEGGAISISSVYSKGLLDTLTQALQSSGVDLSRASISVQIELGKQANIRQSLPTSGAKDDELVSRSQRMARSRVASAEDSDQAVKKLRTRRT